MQGIIVCRRTTVLPLHKPVAKHDLMAIGLCKVLAMLIGYARVSRQDGQDTAVQIEALKQAGVDRIFEEKASGGRWDRPQLHRALDQLRSGDVFVVWKLDRLSRSLKDLLTLMERIDAIGAGFRSLTEAIDTTTPAQCHLVFELESLKSR